MTADQEFVFFELTDQTDTHKGLAGGGVPTPASAFPTSASVSIYQLQDDFVLGSNLPFVRGGGDIGAATPSTGFIKWDGIGGGKLGAARVVIAGSGSSQKSAASIIVADVSGTNDPQTAAISGFARGSTLTSSSGGSNGSLFFNSETETLRDADGLSGNAFYGTTAPNYFVLGVLQTGGAAFEADQNFSGTQVQFRPNVIALGSDPVALPTATALTHKGYTAGLIQTINGLGAVTDNSLFQNTTESPNNVSILPGPGLTATFNVSEIGGGTQFDNAEFGDANFDRSVLLDDDTFSAIDSTAISSQLNETAQSSFNYLTTNDALESSGFVPSGVTFCSCEFLVWGFWGMDIDNGSVSERVHLAQWVAGNVNNANERPTTGTATYSGHAIATVVNGSDVYTAVGDFSMTVNFALPTVGTETFFKITDFDGQAGTSFQDNGSGLSFNGGAVPNEFNGTLLGQGIHSGVNGEMRGSFIQGGGDPAAEAAAMWNVDDGSGYSAAGVIVSSK